MGGDKNEKEKFEENKINEKRERKMKGVETMKLNNIYVKRSSAKKKVKRKEKFDEKSE